MLIVSRNIILVLICFPFFVFGGSREDLKFDFHQNDSSYSFRGSFVVDADPDCLITVILDFEHISKYASGAAAVEMLRQGNNWTEVSYTYRRFIFPENTSVWRRTLYRDRNELVFEMISSKNNLKIMPEVLSSSGYYRIRNVENGCRMEYFQQCNLNTDFLKKTYIKSVRKEAVEFLTGFRDYVEKTCIH